MGREEELSSLHSRLLPDEQSGSSDSDPACGGPICCVLQGLGGAGKTQMALEYTYRYRQDYDAMFWLSAERDHELAASFALIALKLGLMEDDGKSKAGVKQNQVKAIQEDQRWLLIFDNVEEIKDLEMYLPTETEARGSVIVTTQRPRSQRITKDFYNIELLSSNGETWVQSLFKYLEREPTDEAESNLARETSAIVGGLPLAIATIGGYIKESESSVEEFLQIMKRSSNAWEDTQHTKLKHYERTLGTVFNTALSELKNYPAARKLINILAFLNPDNIPKGILVSPHDNEKVKFLSSKAKRVCQPYEVDDELNSFSVLEMTRILRRRQLVRRETSGVEPYLSIHRSLQWSIIVDLSRIHDHRWSVYHQAFVLLRRGMPMSSPIQVPEPNEWPQFERYTPQILNLRTNCLWPEPPVDLPVDFAHILSDMGTYMWHPGLVDDGSEALETAEHILDERGVGETEPLRGDILGNLGILSGFAGVSQREKGMNRRLEALKMRKEVHEDIPKKKVTRNDEIRLYIAGSDVAFGHLQDEKFEEVEEIMERCLKSIQVLGYRGQDTLRIRQILLHHFFAGAEHSVTQLWKFSLVNLMYHSGDVAQSLRINEEVLATRKREGKADKAVEYLSSCLERRKLASWDREGVAHARFRYYLMLKRLGNDGEADSQLSWAFTIRDHLKKECKDYLRDPDPSNELAVFDQMCST
ncbi:MAG: hypothetical protein Q9173_000285 [Seirophora scorigena]